LSSEYTVSSRRPGDAGKKKLNTYTVACTGVIEL
jgi:hypothetical protein